MFYIDCENLIEFIDFCYACNKVINVNYVSLIIFLFDYFNETFFFFPVSDGFHFLWELNGFYGI